MIMNPLDERIDLEKENMKMNIGTLTFHGAHNYGSVLQAYALQTILGDVVKEGNCEIINLRKKSQKDYYSVYNKNKNLKSMLGNIYNFIYRKDLALKHKRFEDFIKKYLPLSKEIENGEQVESIIEKYDAIVCGSDQIWNISSFDFDLSYMLPFEKKERRIAYAASFGGSVATIQNNADKLKELLSEFDSISVREKASQISLSKLLDRKVDRMPDPTMLLKSDIWEKLIENIENPKSDYILFYSLGPSKEDINLVYKIADKLKLKVIITNTANRNDKKMRANRKLSTGPLEFLSLVKNANLVCTSSYHCTLFSIVFKTPFWCLNVEKEERIKSLLNIVGMDDRKINNYNVEMKLENTLTKERFEEANSKLENERMTGLNFLKEALKV